MHRGKYRMRAGDIKGNPGALTTVEKETVDGVLAYNGDKTSQYLSELTHLEDPWKDARSGLPAGVRGSVEISHAAMAEYYEGLLCAAENQ
jgi:hypothetical protein